MLLKMLMINSFSQKKKQTKDIQIYCLNNDTGTGEMRCYNLLEGIQLSYNTLNMQTTYQKGRA